MSLLPFPKWCRNFYIFLYFSNDIFFSFLLTLLIHFERKRERALVRKWKNGREREKERERERESQAGSAQSAWSQTRVIEPTDPTNGEIMTWAETKNWCLTHWATQVPLHDVFSGSLARFEAREKLVTSTYHQFTLKLGWDFRLWLIINIAFL